MMFAFCNMSLLRGGRLCQTLTGSYKFASVNMTRLPAICTDMNDGAEASLLSLCFTAAVPFRLRLEN
jgi:hypothetical protein